METGIAARLKKKFLEISKGRKRVEREEGGVLTPKFMSYLTLPKIRPDRSAKELLKAFEVPRISMFPGQLHLQAELKRVVKRKGEKNANRSKSPIKGNVSQVSLKNRSHSPLSFNSRNEPVDDFSVTSQKIHLLPIRQNLRKPVLTI